ncbi:hypothetical protein B6U99_01545 [Candidatus Geothermarchaeota archaeon ex4572_27]|nr:MAG: hypothetical protein B6U99_01545 [Candidatus Geothermarchaeota archaeon ex4572_27]
MAEVVSTHVKVAYVAVFGAMAAVISLLKIEIPFPILVWLKFDFAEIPDLIAYLLGGLWVGVVTAFVHMLLLNIAAMHPVIGPVMKFLAVISMMVGISAWRKLKHNPGMLSSLAAMPEILRPFFGEIGSVEAAFMIALGLTGIYNALHTVLTIVISYKVFDVAVRYIRLPMASPRASGPR